MMRNVTKIAKFWTDKSKVGQFTQIRSEYGLESVNTEPQKDF